MVAEADVVRVTDHVIQYGLAGSHLRALQPEPETNKSEQVSRRPRKPRLWDGVFAPEDTSDTGLRQQQEALVRRQDNAVGHVEAVQQNRHTSCVGIVGEKTSKVVQLNHLEKRAGLL